MISLQTESRTNCFKLHRFRTHLITISGGSTLDHLWNHGKRNQIAKLNPWLAHFFSLLSSTTAGVSRGDRILPRPTTKSHKNPPLFAQEATINSCSHSISFSPLFSTLSSRAYGLQILSHICESTSARRDTYCASAPHRQ